MTDEKRQARIRHHLYETNEGIEEHAKRIVDLEELVKDMWDGMCGYAHDCRNCEHYELFEGQRFVGECAYHRRIKELGVPL